MTKTSVCVHGRVYSPINCTAHSMRNACVSVSYRVFVRDEQSAVGIPSIDTVEIVKFSIQQLVCAGWTLWRTHCNESSQTFASCARVFFGKTNGYIRKIEVTKSSLIRVVHTECVEEPIKYGGTV